MDLQSTLESGAEWLRKAFASPVPTIVPWKRDDAGDMYVAVRKDHRLARVPGFEFARASHQFDDVLSFAAWLNRHAEADSTEITIAASGAGAARLGLEAPDGDYLSLESPRDPTLEAFLEVLNRPMSQRQFQQLVRGHGEAILEPPAAELLTMLGTLKVATGESFESHLDETGATRFQGRTRSQTVEGTVPPTIKLRTPFFQGVFKVGRPPDIPVDLEAGLVAEYDLELCVLFDAEESVPKFTLTAPGFARVDREAVLDIKAYLEALLEPGFLVGLGTLQRLCRRSPADADLE